MYTNEAIATFEPSAHLRLEFAYYAFPEMIVRNASENIYGAQMLNQQLIRDARLVLPPSEEQSAIAAFLDHETGKIDALVKEQTRLVELLKEKRQAAISRAVTKGLNPDAPMKPSGIEWLGEVPAHWDVTRLKYLVRPGTSITYGIVQAGPDIAGGVPYIRASDMSGHALPLEGYLRTSREIDEAYARSRVSTGDLVIAIRATIGKPLIVPNWLEGANLTQGTAKFSPDSKTSVRYVYYYLGSAGAAAEFERLAKGATFKEITLDMLRRFPVPLPNLEEQAQITDWLDRICTEIDGLLGRVQDGIKLLKERRSTLISAAVTGKLDVRDLVERSHVSESDVGRVRLLVAAEFVGRLSHKPTFGRVKLQKLAYLAEAHAGVSELHGEYHREAAGPLDRRMMREMEQLLAEEGYATVQQPDGAGSQVSYCLTGRREQYRDELENMLQDRLPTFKFLIGEVGELNTKGSEAVATLYAVWNDALIDGASPSDEAIVSGVLHDWHPQKREKFTSDELHTWLGWMRRRGFVPSGAGPRTRLERLFA